MRFPIIIGISEPVHSEEQLKEFAENSKKKYDLTQKQRAMETKLRSLKNQRLAASTAGDELEAKRLQRKINEQQTIYRRFSEKHGLLYDTKRASVEGYRKISVANIQKRDIISIGRSVGAMAKNYEVRLPDGTISKLTEGTDIVDIEVFAGKGTNVELRVKHHLVENYGGKADNWQHTKGRGFVDTPNGSKKAMLHWFEEETIGIVEMFVKGWSKK